ncbi:hypothetical protein GCM10028820_13930 [Tessaracoccus terricola]
MTGPELDRARLMWLLEELDKELLQRGQRARLYVVGGANMALAIDETRTTADVDSVVKEGWGVVFDAAEAVASRESGVPLDWLNSDFTGGTPDGGIAWSWMDEAAADTPAVGYAGDALTLELASPEMMLALKTLAQRDKDLADIYVLMRLTGIRSAEALGRNLARFTGRRIFDDQGRPGMPFHIDPAFSRILDNAPEDLRPEEPERRGFLTRLRAHLPWRDPQ